ncbi:PadR family transcriptional regulator [Spirochaeta cellobiosiphila]|uniref:PadR family transcriptional regulator n=1 Tax=Spirochaeta cellobiosiphila TaxID=504483 RepID=UPI0003FDC4FA|nr:PadR family transcriptional regulator [Spirochaeta cellobiosiphila]
MSLKYGLLGLLGYSDATGYELKKIFDESLNFFWQAQKSQIYKELVNLEKQGWLSVSLVLQEDKPNKKVYSLTPEGREAFLKWLKEDRDNSDLPIRSSFLMKVFFLGELSKERAIEKLEAFLEEQKKEGQEHDHINEYIGNYSDISSPEQAVFWKITARSGVLHHEANIRWAEEALQLLKEV